MKSSLLLRNAWKIVALGALLGLIAFAAEAKPIRLRNPVAAGRNNAQQRTQTSAASGLFLVQFRSPVTAEMRQQLSGMGVDLLRYVPDDTFVARFANTQPADVRALSFVESVSDYRREHKVHRQLLQRATAAKQSQAAPEDLEIAVLLSPRASDSEAAQTKGHFNQVRQESKLRSGHIIRGKIKPAQLDALSRSDSVLWIEPSPQMKMFDEISSKIVAGDGGPNLLEMQALGYDGTGVKVAVADSGLDNGDEQSMHSDLLGRTPAFFFYGSPGQLFDAADEHSHGTHVAGIIAGDGATGEVDDNGNLWGLGVAPGASIIAQRIFDGVGNYAAPPSFERLTRDAKRAGADIGSNSWGDDTQGRYDLSAMEFDELVRDADALTLGDQAYILEFSAGNAGPGPQTIGSPAVAKNVIATGASDNDRPDLLIYADGIDAMADFSSRGPCEDGRIKPDVVAPGTWIASLQSQSATDQFAWAAISPNYQYQGGTSQAGPHVSGAAAIFVQYYRSTHTNTTPSPALVKAALINSAVDMSDPTQTGPVPNNDEGWGRVDLTQIVESYRSVDFVDQSAPLTSGQIFERKILLASPDEPFKVTLAYTDVPGFPGAIPALVNDLDLEVVAPNGSIYRGNQFNDGESVANAPGRDSINNVEGVFISFPNPGEYTLRVRARNVVDDARVDTGVVDQDFALVTSGLLAEPGESVVFFDRNAYTAPSVMRLTVVDADLAGTPSVSILARSTTETLGENYTLVASGSSGVFTGSVATATGAAITDGKLQIAHNNHIEVRYFDVSAGFEQSAFAFADLVPPALTGIVTTNEFGSTVISWVTDELATSVVRYNTNSTLSQAVTNSALTTDHAVGISDLISNRTYFFHVSSTDEAGNTATNDNGGALFSFVAPTVAAVLLVDAYYSDLFDVPPLSGYTTPLTQLGISYDVWTKESRGAPTLTNMLPYRAVIWRLAEFPFDASNYGWSVAEQNALADYLRRGGSLFVASMELLTRLEEGGFPNALRGMLHVQSYIVDNDPDDVPDVVGSRNDPAGSGIDAALDYAAYEDPTGFKDLLGLPADVSDTFTPDNDAAPVFSDSFGEVTGLKFPRTGLDSPGRVVFLSFPLDAMPMTGSATNNRVHLLRNILQFLVPGFDGRATLALDQSSYSVPGLVVVEVDDADRTGTGSLNITYSSTTQSGATTLALAETTRPGTFRGTIELVPQTSAPASGTLRAKNGDTVQVNYADASSGLTMHASATVDTIVPSITGVAADVDYEQAIISWETSEESDALVQYGESQFLGKTAFDPFPDTYHQVPLTGLQPDTTYYYQVVSRDPAGNTVVKDNNGVPFTFHTLAAIVPPWSDSLDTGAANWSTFDTEDAQSRWTLGVPDNGVVTTAHSAPNCWGSNLNGDVLDYAETFLISPAIQLTGGNSARLSFWHVYDFSERSPDDIFEAGTLYVVTDGGSQAAALAQYDDANSGWELEELDLSPYAGKVIYLVWAYQIVSFEAAARPGWLVDDVSITVSNIVGGTVNVTNNLWQASFVLSGPANRNGKGTSLTVTNAPPGEYIVEFGDVAFYNTPPSQTNTLVSGGTINFIGNYTFADSNANGMADEWEAAYFGSVSPSRTRTTDSDGDGLSDYGEFVAASSPTNSASALRASPALQSVTGALQLKWPTGAGHGYRVLGSSNAVLWAPYSDWIRATGLTTTWTAPPRTNGAPYLFRIEAQP